MNYLKLAIAVLFAIISYVVFAQKDTIGVSDDKLNSISIIGVRITSYNVCYTKLLRIHNNRFKQR